MPNCKEGWGCVHEKGENRSCRTTTIYIIQLYLITLNLLISYQSKNTLSSKGDSKLEKCQMKANAFSMSVIIMPEYYVLIYFKVF